MFLGPALPRVLGTNTVQSVTMETFYVKIFFLSLIVIIIKLLLCIVSFSTAIMGRPNQSNQESTVCRWKMKILDFDFDLGGAVSE